MRFRAFAAGAVALAVVAGLVPASPASSAQLAAGSCRPGQSTPGFGLNWKCVTVDRTRVFAAQRDSAGEAAPGDAGSCRVGDWMLVGQERLTCLRTGSTSTWTGLRRGALLGRAEAWIQSRPARIQGSCRSNSWLQLTGVRIACARGTGAGAWTAQSQSGQGAGTDERLPKEATKDACINAWWDKEFAGVVPQLAVRQSADLTNRIWEPCHRGYAAVMTEAERKAAYVDFYRQVGDLVAAEVQRVSASTGMTPCQAVLATLKPHFSDGYGLSGWDQTSFLPILYKEWQGGPILGKLSGNSIDCNAGGQVSVQLRRHYRPRHEGPYYPPLGTPDAEWVLTSGQEEVSMVRAAVCLVWSPTFGNDRPGSPAQVAAYNYTDISDGINFVSVDLEVTQCEFKVAEAAGLPVTWAASDSLSASRTVTDAQAGIWHMMSEGCEWRLQPADGSAPVQWSASDGPYMAVELKAGDQFASTCKFVKRDFEHMLVAPDGMFPLTSLSPGARRPTTPATCRYAVTTRSTLRSPLPASALAPYAGSPVTFDVLTWGDGTGKFLRSVGCGYWQLA